MKPDNTDADFRHEFGEHVRTGLKARPRKLSSRYIYDAAGSKLFERIMALPEYYLTRAEYAILESQSGAIADALPAWDHFDLVEFGAGDGTKTRLLLQELLGRSASFRYLPLDISAQALKDLGANLAHWLPGLDYAPLQAEYFEGLESLRGGRPKLVLFLGSNIGNFTPELTLDFLRRLSAALSPGDCLLTGFDLKKEPKRILAAYNDSQGVTQEFNRNLLHRINRELGGHFDPEAFEFVPSYQPESGEMRAYLVSRKDQEIAIDALGESFSFRAWEAIHTEISRKYDLPLIESLADQTGFRVKGHFHDGHWDFVDSLWERA